MADFIHKFCVTFFFKFRTGGGAASRLPPPTLWVVAGLWRQLLLLLSSNSRRNRTDGKCIRQVGDCPIWYPRRISHFWLKGSIFSQTEHKTDSSFRCRTWSFRGTLHNHRGYRGSEMSVTAATSSTNVTVFRRRSRTVADKVTQTLSALLVPGCMSCETTIIY